MNSSEEDSTQVKDTRYLLDLVRKASEGNRDALSELSRNPTLELELMRISNWAIARFGSRPPYYDTEDLRQELYIRLWSNVQQLSAADSDAQILEWLTQTARNYCIDKSRKTDEQDAYIKSDESVKDYGTIRESQTEDVYLKEVLDKIDPGERKVLELFLGGYSPRQVAEKLSISQATAYRLLKKVQNTMFGELDEITAKMKKSQKVIDREKELTRQILRELTA